MARCLAIYWLALAMNPPPPAVLSLGDLRLVAGLRQRATAHGLGLGAFAAFVVRRYAEEASNEEWVTLIGELGRSADPGLAFIKRALAHATHAPV